MLELQFEPGIACGLLTRSDSSTGVLTLNLLSGLDFRVDGQLLCPLSPAGLRKLSAATIHLPSFLSHQHSGTSPSSPLSLPLPTRAILSPSTLSTTAVGSGERHTPSQRVNTRAARLHSSYSEQRRSNENGDWPNSGSVLSPSDDDTLVKPYSPQSACSSSTHTAVTLSHSTSHLGSHQPINHPGLLTPGSLRHPLSSILLPPFLCDPTTRPPTHSLSRCPSTTYSLFSSTDLSTLWSPLPQHSPTTGGCASAGGTPILA